MDKLSKTTTTHNTNKHLETCNSARLARPEIKNTDGPNRNKRIEQTHHLQSGKQKHEKTTTTTEICPCYYYSVITISKIVCLCDYYYYFYSFIIFKIICLCDYYYCYYNINRLCPCDIIIIIIIIVLLLFR